MHMFGMRAAFKTLGKEISNFFHRISNTIKNKYIHVRTQATHHLRSNEQITPTHLAQSNPAFVGEASAINATQKTQLIDIMIQEFYTQDFKSGNDFLNYLRKKYSNNVFLSSLVCNEKDDKYGIFTFTLPGSATQSDIEFRIKKMNAYGGPKTENYIDRIELKIQAALCLIQEKPFLNTKKRELEMLRDYYIELIKKDCFLDHQKYDYLNLNDVRAIADFNEKNTKANQHLGMFMALLTKILYQDGKTSEDIKVQLYNIEKELMSKKRPKRVTIRKPQTDGNYIEVNITNPVNKEKTISSAKKDDSGIANWLKSNNRIYEMKEGQYQLVHKSESYRSASIIPHENIGKGKFSRQLAIETARRNVCDELIPALAEELINKGQANTDPLEINFEMLTLLSPIHKRVDAKDTNNPDATQFSAIRAAMNHYNGRVFEVVLKNGERKRVKFNATYHNYGANLARGFKIEKATNQKAFNELIDRSMKTLANKPGYEPYRLLFDHIPQFTALDKANIVGLTRRAQYLYVEIEKHQMTSKKHNLLTTLHAKKLSGKLLLEEQDMYDILSDEFIQSQEKIHALNKEARLVEGKIRHIHVKLAKDRENYFLANYSDFDQILTQMEADRSNPAVNSTVDHIRTFVEYARLAKKGYDPRARIVQTTITGKRIAKTNRRNYEIQSYIQALCAYNNTIFHKTCKSGKDRTNSAEEKYKAKMLMAIKLNRIPKYDEHPDDKKVEMILFERGFSQGPGNDICGDNMKPGAQQVAAKDVATDTLNIRGVQAAAGLQKGIDAIDIDGKMNGLILHKLKKLDLFGTRGKKLAKATEEFEKYQKMRSLQAPVALPTTPQKRAAVVTFSEKNRDIEVISTTTEDLPVDATDKTLKQ